MHGRRVIVVGAGMAGLSAANHLVSSGLFDVTVLEAANRAGGRVHTVQCGEQSQIIELGANFIHGGSLSNSVYSLAASIGLIKEKVLHDRMSGFCYNSSGVAIPRELSQNIWEVYQQWEADFCQSTTLPMTDFDTYFRSRFTIFLQSLPPEDHLKAECVFNCLQNYSRFHEGGGELKDISGDSSYCELPGGNVLVSQGLLSIIQYLAGSLPQHSVKYNHEVSRIYWDRPEGISIVCANGEKHYCDHVIMSTSLGCLKANTIQFIPPLNDQKLDAIKRIGFGSVNKLFLWFEEPFWVPGSGSIKLGWSNEEMRSQRKEEWYKNIFAFDEVLGHDRILLAWVSGSAASYIETLDDEEVINTCSRLLRQFLGNPAIQSPKRVIRSSWQSNKNTRGAYSFFSVSERAWDKAILASPLTRQESGSLQTGQRHIVQKTFTDRFLEVGKPLVLFAGEATSPTFYSTMHGARDSGLREAQRLIDFYNSVAKL